jgi:hypothetical protein
MSDAKYEAMFEAFSLVFYPTPWLGRIRSPAMRLVSWCHVVVCAVGDEMRRGRNPSRVCDGVLGRRGVWRGAGVDMRW